MQIVFAYDKKQVIQALRYHFINRSEIRILIILVNVFAIVSAALFYFHKVSPMAFLISSILWLCLLASLWFFLPNTVYKKASTFQQSFKMTIGERGIMLASNNMQTEWSWDKFSSFIETPHFIHLYFDSKAFFLVPKAAIEDHADMEEVRKLLREKIRKT